MKIWIDILTPKQLLFAEKIAQKLNRHEILFTSRTYNEVSKLAKIRDFSLICVGKHGGIGKTGKLEASISRIEKLIPKITRFEPDLTISFCSPEAARVSFGLGIRHIAFCDSPHATSVMKLTLPLIQKLLIPWIIPKKEFSKYGIKPENIITYRAIDASVTIKRKSDQKTPFKKSHKKNILIRMEEEEAAYISDANSTIPIIENIVKRFEDENIVILGRYQNQVNKLKKTFGSKVTVLKMSYDGKMLLENCDVFIGSGGTMTAEAALLGLPVISYNAVPNIVENYLVKKNFIKRETNPKKIVKILEKIFESSNKDKKTKADKFLKSMEDPVDKLVKLI